VVTLNDFSGNRRVRVIIDNSVNQGNASIQVLSTALTETVIDKNVGSQACDCSPPVVFSKQTNAVIIPLYIRPLEGRPSSCAESRAFGSNCYQDSPRPCVAPPIIGPNPPKEKPAPPCACDKIPAGKELTDDWRRLIAAKRAHPEIEVWAIVNPTNGPVPKKLVDGNFERIDEELLNDYKVGICQLKAAGIKVLGYVCTKYAGQTATNCGCELTPPKVMPTNCVEVYSGRVRVNIDAWYDLYYPDIPDGIFFDEMANEDGLSPNAQFPGDPDIMRSAFYKNLSDYAKRPVDPARPELGNRFSFTVGNPGATTLSVFVNTVDAIIIYEKPGFLSKDALKPTDLPRDTPLNPPDYAKWGILVYKVKDLGDISIADFSNAQSLVKYIYVTSDGTDMSKTPDNVWDEVPSFEYLDKLFTRLLGQP
jgi:hypothetical protein